MDCQKTGQLIAQARKDKGLTQKELAEGLHVSDRAVSKWERGAGFPAVDLLEPLASALGLTVTDLLRGQRVDGPEMTALEAVRALSQAGKRGVEKRRLNRFSLRAFLLAMLLFGVAYWAVDHVILVRNVFPVGWVPRFNDPFGVSFIAASLLAGAVLAPLARRVLAQEDYPRYLLYFAVLMAGMAGVSWHMLGNIDWHGPFLLTVLFVIPAGISHFGLLWLWNRKKA